MRKKKFVISVPVPVGCSHMWLRRIRCDLQTRFAFRAGSGSALLFLSVLTVFFVLMLQIPVPVLQKRFTAPDPYSLTDFAFDFIARVLLRLLSNCVTGTGTGNEKAGLLSPAGSGSRLIQHTEGFANVFYLLGSDTFCFKNVL
jgi:hypothetical protein